VFKLERGGKLSPLASLGTVREQPFTLEG